MDHLDNVRRVSEEAHKALQRARSDLASAQTALDTALVDFVVANSRYTAAVERSVASIAKPASEPANFDAAGDDFDQLVMDAGLSGGARRMEARRRLDRMGPNIVPPLLRLLALERRDRRLRIRAVASLGAACVTVVMLQVLLGDWTFGVTSWLLLGCIGGLRWILKPTRRHRSALELLAKVSDVRLVGLLAESLEVSGSMAGREIRDALKELLPRLKTSDRHLLSTVQLDSLYRAMDRHDPALSIAILRAVEQIGDERALDYVARLADGKGIAARYDHVRAAAQECVPGLVDRRIGERENESLLRPAVAPWGAETLLRPVSGASTVPPEQLLRSAPAEIAQETH